MYRHGNTIIVRRKQLGATTAATSYRPAATGTATISAPPPLPPSPSLMKKNSYRSSWPAIEDWLSVSG
jgi:hypothetical protein